MPLTEKGREILAAMEKQYGAERGKEVFYASANKGTITGVHDGDENGMEFDAKLDSLGSRCAAYDQRDADAGITALAEKAGIASYDRKHAVK